MEKLNATCKLRPLWKAFFQERTLLAFSFLASLCLTFIPLWVPQLVGQFIDRFHPGEVVFPREGKRDLILLASLMLLWILSQVALNRFSFLLVHRVLSQFRQALFRKVCHLPLLRLDQETPGDVLSHLTNDLEAVKEGFSTGLFQAAVQLTVLMGSLLAIFTIEARVALVILALTPITFGMTYGIARFSSKYFRQRQALLGQLSRLLQEGLEQARLYRSLHQEEKLRRDFSQENDQLYTVGQKAQFYSSLTNPGARFVNNLTYLAVGYLCARLGFAGELSYGEIAAILGYTLAYSGPMNRIANLVGQWQKARAGAARVLDFLAKEEEEEEGRETLVVKQGEIDFEGVTFRYVEEKPFYENFHLHIPAGGKLAIVGPTGGGKTTLVNLLMRFYPCQKGRIRIDGQDVAACTLSSLYEQVGMVLQETWLHTGTVAENIAYGRPDASRQEIVEAAQAAHAHGFICQLPEGYDTFLHEGGSTLSQGQKQLLTLARVFLLQPKILILDEATSNVDTYTEQRVQEAFLKMMEGRTTLVIAHRLATIRQADQILVVDQGRVLETGTHQELLAKNGFYASMHRSQYE